VVRAMLGRSTVIRGLLGYGFRAQHEGGRPQVHRFCERDHRVEVRVHLSAFEGANPFGIYACRGRELTDVASLFGAYLLECFAKTTEVRGLSIVLGNGKTPKLRCGRLSAGVIGIICPYLLADG
jgi:hypothetical protein